jgi:hypothetical protein
MKNAECRMKNQAIGRPWKAGRGSWRDVTFSEEIESGLDGVFRPRGTFRLR